MSVERVARHSLLPIVAAAALILILSACGEGQKKPASSDPAIASAFWGHWTDAATGEGWYISGQGVTDPLGTVLSVQAASEQAIVVYSGSTQYSLAVEPAGTLRVAYAGSGDALLFKRNGSDAPFTARLWAEGGSRALGPATGISLVLQNVLNAANAIPVESGQDGALVIPAQAIAGDDYEVRLEGGTEVLSSVHVSAPDEDVGTISLPPPLLGYTFKVYLKDSGPLDFRYADGASHALTLVIENTGSKAASGLSYSLASSDPPNFSLSSLDGYGLTGSIASLEPGATLELPLSASLGTGADFGGKDYLEPAILATISGGGASWSDKASVRFYRERRWVRLYADHNLCGYFKSPDGIAIRLPATTSQTLELPYRSEPYETFLFSDYSSYSTDAPGRRNVTYGVLASPNATKPAGPAPCYSAFPQNTMELNVGVGDITKGFPEEWFGFYTLNDGNEPNDAPGSGPTVYRGGSFHGFLRDGDYDAYTLDFSQGDPLAGTASAADDFVLSYAGAPGGAALIPQEGSGQLILIDLKTRLDPASFADWRVSVSASGGVRVGLQGSTSGSAGVSLNSSASASPDLKQLYTYAETQTNPASTVYSDDRLFGLYLWIPAGFAGASATLTATVYEDSAYTLHGSYACEVPIAAGR